MAGIRGGQLGSAGRLVVGCVKLLKRGLKRAERALAVQRVDIVQLLESRLLTFVELCHRGPTKSGGDAAANETNQLPIQIPRGPARGALAIEGSHIYVVFALCVAELVLLVVDPAHGKVARLVWLKVGHLLGHSERLSPRGTQREEFLELLICVDVAKA